MANPTAATARIDETLAALPPDQRTALQALRETIAAAAPEAEETISYSMPAFRYHGRALVSYAAFKTHCSFFPMSAAMIESLHDELADFATSKGTLQFSPEHLIPAELVERMVRERMAQIDGRRQR
ncbi:MAG TPA: DUF1801 domain-containing protein [Candidatus Saccharimonadales bacterium]|nr:DUF1801 domain-containing protein [Candidatus Saccharimonadales bacterium]